MYELKQINWSALDESFGMVAEWKLFMHILINSRSLILDRAPCTKLHIQYKGEQRDRTKTLAEFPDHILNDDGQILA